MSILIVTHPHDIDDGLLRKELPYFVQEVSMPSLFIRDGDGRPYGGENIYNGELKPDDRLGKVGRASLRDKSASELVQEYGAIFLAGGNLSECLASTYNSIVRAAEREKEHINIILVEDLIYAQDKKNGKVGTMIDVVHSGKLEKYLQLFQESSYVDRGHITSKKILEKST